MEICDDANTQDVIDNGAAATGAAGGAKGLLVVAGGPLLRSIFQCCDTKRSEETHLRSIVDGLVVGGVDVLVIGQLEPAPALHHKPMGREHA